MLQIHGVGFATPKNQISNQLLKELNPNFNSSAFESEYGMCSRNTALKLDYLKETKNKEIKLALSSLEQSDLEIGKLAIEIALSRAGISLNDIGLVLGETSTPFQTIPSQAQRLAGHMGLKVKAYDILGGSASPAVHLNTLNSWREDRLSKYTLLVFSNFPTVFIDYSSTTPLLSRLSDGVCALVVGSGTKGKLSLSHVASRPDLSLQGLDSVDVSRALMLSEQSENIIINKIEKLTENLLSLNPKGSRTNFFIPSQIPSKEIYRIAALSGFDKSEVLVSSSGDCLSSAGFGLLAGVWDRLQTGDKAYLPFCGLGLQTGEIILEVN